MSDNLDCFELEMNRLKSLSKRDLGREILETLSHKETEEFLIPLMESRINIKKEFDKKYRKILKKVEETYAPDTFEFNFLVDVLWLLTDSDSDLANEKQLQELSKYWLFNESRRPTQKSKKTISFVDFESLKERAKQTPIESLLTNNIKRSGANRLVTLCPFHEEKTPSLTIFTDDNTYYCFGCGAKGDSISFYQNIFGVDFVEAVKSLSERY